ncbi:MAG: hypothetical protein EKK57_07595 [Proteobacteria bacterium]|nr:MAG: hypothetical protein EKK57_07595 [Pseudomonadota bacterium]
MTIRDKVTRLEKQLGFTRYNPEMVDMAGLKFQVMFDTPAVNDTEEMGLLLKQAELENFNFIMIFDTLEPQPNFLVERIIEMNNVNLFPILITLFHDKENEIFVQVSASVEDNQIILEMI